MRTSTATAILAAALVTGTMLGVGAAQADRKHAAVQPSAPQSIAEVLRAGGGTVVGAVTERGANWLTIEDGSARVDVTTGHFLPEGVRKDDPITVVGRAWRGGLMASEIILADGTSHGPESYAATPGDRFDGEDD